MPNHNLLTTFWKKVGPKHHLLEKGGTKNNLLEKGWAKNNLLKKGWAKIQCKFNVNSV